MPGLAGMDGRLMLQEGRVQSTRKGQPAQFPHEAVADPSWQVAQHRLAATGGEMQNTAVQPHIHCHRIKERK